MVTETSIDNWPKWAQWFYAHRQAEETGVGDTARRLFSKMGGEQYQLLMKTVGMPCKCSQKQAQWNSAYPY